VVRLMITEGRKHPDLVEFYWDNVVSRGISALRMIVDRGVENGEFRKSAVNDLPHLLVLPALFSVVWQFVFQKCALDTDRLIESHVNMVIESIKSAQGAAQ
jgi:hypothetical protein